jgi:vacuolar-type H+-ATPase subunit I/STV1
MFGSLMSAPTAQSVSIASMNTSGMRSPWMLGAMMLAMGLIVIAFHQYWRGVTAVLISLFGWFVALRGVTMMAFPAAMKAGTGDTLASPGLLLAARVFLGLLAVMGLWLTYVGWRTMAAV